MMLGNIILPSSTPVLFYSYYSIVFFFCLINKISMCVVAKTTYHCSIL